MLSLALVAACSSSQKTAPASLVRVDPEPRGANCAAGGTVVRTGVDRNDDGVLQDDEIASTSYVCVGGASLVRVDPEPVGTACASGGTAVRTGADANGDGVLQDGEVSSTRYLCSGTSSLVRLDPEPAGTSCAAGGTAVRTGRDANADGILQDGEVSRTEYVCGTANPYATGWAANPAGAFGGTLVQSAWIPVGREATLLKTSARSRLRVTVSDNLRVGYGASPSEGSYAVRMNGGNIGCSVSQFENLGTNSKAQNIHFPLANVCLTEPLPPGLYRFEAWAQSRGGDGNVGWTTDRPVLLVEEFDGAYATTTFGPEFATTSTTLVQVPGRSVKYAKKETATILKVTYADTLRVGYWQDPGEGYVMVRRNGVDTPCAIGKKDGQGTTGDFHDPFVVTCILAGVGAGDHEFSVWVRAAKWGATNVGQLYLGWSRNPLLLVEELPATSPTRSFTVPTSVTGEVSGAWSAVTDRQVLHTVTAPGKTLKVTYSDTFGGALGCNAAPSFFQLYVDGAPTGCMNNMYVDVGSVLAQAHHHPINHTCLVPGLAPGQHTFAIYHTNMNINAQTPTSCGTNSFGFGRGQAALIVEELP